MRTGVVAKNHLQIPSTMFLQQSILKMTIVTVQILYTV